MGIYIGTEKMKKCYIGTKEVKKIYIGTQMVWRNTVLVEKPTNTSVVVAYDHSEHTNGYTCPTGVTMVGEDRGTNGNVYTATYTPQEGFAWADDGTQTPVTVTLTIQYVWTKWNAVASRSENTDWISVPTGSSVKIWEGWAECGWSGSSYGFDGNHYYMDGNKHLHHLPDELSTYDETHYQYTSVGNWDGTSDVMFDASHGNMEINAEHSAVYAYFDNSWGSGQVVKRTLYTSYSRGTTQYTDVSSTNHNAFPKNGTWDNTYWYVKTWSGDPS